MKWLTMIPLIGGMSIANEQETGNKPEVILSYEPFQSNDKHLVEYFKMQDKYYHLDKVEIPKLKNIDFVSSVCPCAGLSSFSTGKKGTDAVQNEWMFKSAELVLEKIKPKVYFGENAPGLFSDVGKGVVEKLKEIGKQNGYSFSIYKTNTNMHGIPQNRSRTFYFFWKSQTAPIMHYYKRDKLHLKEYLNEIPDNVTNHNKSAMEQKIQTDYTYRWLKTLGPDFRKMMSAEKCSSVFSFAQRYDMFKGLIAFAEKENEVKAVKRLNAIVEKLTVGGNYWDESCYYFDSEFNALIARSMTSLHPTEDRYITYREAMHLMGLPHDFELKDEREFNMIAQNVPVCTARDMTKEVIKFINGELEDSGSTYIKQDNVVEKIVYKELPINSLDGLL